MSKPRKEARRIRRQKPTDPMWINKIVERLTFEHAYVNRRALGFKPSRLYEDTSVAPDYVYKVIFETWNAGEQEGWVEEEVVKTDSALFSRFQEESGGYLQVDKDRSIINFKWSDEDMEESDLTDDPISSDETFDDSFMADHGDDAVKHPKPDTNKRLKTRPEDRRRSSKIAIRPIFSSEEEDSSESNENSPIRT
ncbi:unnamed protein product [Caenorhabditis auriculariae]|uniref:Uncharacterized protein n=1 Tax=Caenorhabditis auriculariae TaxID=2777116 RepID=A0A8S1HPV8_9PELO|nr:unnamed protein product [Caenorhabditis auriculariae]